MAPLKMIGDIMSGGIDPDDDYCSWQAVYIANRVIIPPDDRVTHRETRKQ